MKLSYYLLMGEAPRVPVPGGVLDYRVTGKVHVVECEVENDGEEAVEVELRVTGSTRSMQHAIYGHVLTPKRFSIAPGSAEQFTARVVLREGCRMGEPLQLAMHAELV